MSILGKIKFALVGVVLCLGFFACNDDDEFLGDKDSPFYGKKLFGTWEITWTKGSEIDNGVKEEWDEADEGSFLVFDEDRSGYSYAVDDSLKDYFIWKVKENQLGIKLQGNNVFKYGTIDQLTENELVITMENDTCKETESYKRIIVNDSIPEE